jgi:hypothetical protein
MSAGVGSTSPDRLLRRLTRALLSTLILAGCAHAPRAIEPPRLQPDQVAQLLPSKVQDKDGWARDLVAALDTNRISIDVEHLCGVIAVTDQESGFQANPVVQNLPKIARRALEEKAQALGPLGPTVLKELLEVQAPGAKKSFDARIETLRTEADLDRLYRDLLAEHKRRHPILYAGADLGASLFDTRDFAERNPVTTAGSMQVSVRFAEEHARKLRRDPALVRDELYTRGGGLLYGTARLWLYDADYELALYRFADFNAGFYASRNAAFQEQLASLTGTKLALDGDLLAYDALGEVKSDATRTMAAIDTFREEFAPALSSSQVRRDARLEKTADFEKTKTWAAVRRAYAEHRRKTAQYARLPELTLSSPKLQRQLTTAWFAKAVDKRYQSCLARADEAGLPR